MKQKFIQNNVPTPPFVVIRKETLEDDISKAAVLVGFPLIIKPSSSYSSNGISEKSVVFDESEAVSVAKQAEEGIELITEKFLPGREFTVLVSGDKEQGIRAFTPIELIYGCTIPTHQRFQTFYDRVLFDQLEPEVREAHKEREVFKWIPVIKEDEAKAIEKIAMDAYLAVEGSGYGRVDIRSDQEEVSISNLYVLEVNSNPLTHLVDISPSTDIILMAKESIEEVTHDMMRYALNRREERGKAAGIGLVKS